MDNNSTQELKIEKSDVVQPIEKSETIENSSPMNKNVDDNNKKVEEGEREVEAENITDIKENNNSNSDNVEKTETSEKVEESDEELEIQNLSPPRHHCYSYNITNISNNKEDLGAGFRSRLRNLNSPTRTSTTSSTTTSTTYSYTNNNVNHHPSHNNFENKKTTTTTTSTTTSTTTTTTTTTHIPSTDNKQNNSFSSTSNTNQESSIPKSESSSTSNAQSIPKPKSKPTPTPTPTSTTPNHTDPNPNESSTSTAAAGKQEATEEEDEEEKKRHMFECNICLDTASDPVVTMCGHFYCWPCIAMWLERSNQCPVCKSGISKEKIIPVYARGAERKDPREKDIPHRPAGHREEPEPRPRRSPFNFQTSFSTFGLFPGFSFTFSNGGAQPTGFNPFFNPFNLGPEYPQPDSSSQRRTNQDQNGQGGEGRDPNAYQNYILSAFLFFIIFSILSSVLLNF